MVGCVKKPPPADPHTLIIGISYEAKSLLPYRSNDQNSSRLLSLVGESLFEKNENGELNTNLVKDYKIFNKTKIEIQLKTDLLFSDGSPMNSDAVIASLNEYKNAASVFRSNLKNILKIEKIDDRKFIIELKEAKNILS